MFNYYPIHSQQRDLQIWASAMRRNSLRIAPVSAIPPISSTQIHQTNLSDTWSSTNTGAHSKWCLPAWKSPQQETLQDTKNRQNSVEVDDQLLQNDWYRAQQRVIYAAQREYEWAIKNGIAKEQARAVLPEGLIESRLYMNGTLRSWIHFIELRSGNGTQKEHQLIALACAKAIAAIFPMSESLVQ